MICFYQSDLFNWWVNMHVNSLWCTEPFSRAYKTWQMTRYTTIEIHAQYRLLDMIYFLFLLKGICLSCLDVEGNIWNSLPSKWRMVMMMMIVSRFLFHFPSSFCFFSPTQNCNNYEHTHTSLRTRERERAKERERGSIKESIK